MHNAVKNAKGHHFADDTNLRFSNKYLKILRKNINSDLALLLIGSAQIDCL